MLAFLDRIRGQAERAASGVPALVMRAESIASSIMHGEHSKRRAGTGEKFWQFRPYDSSDRPQDIDWKQSAKGQHVFVREKEWQNPQKVLFWCASGSGMEYSSNPALLTKHESALVLSLTLALLMTKGGEQVAALGHKRPGRSEAALQSLAETLTRNPIKGALPEAQALPMNAALVMVGDFLDDLDDIKTCFDALDGRSRQVILIQVLDPAEADLPFEGRALFRAPGLEASEPVRIEHVADIRREYQARIEAHRAGLAELCARYGWLYLYYRTDHDLASVAEELWVKTA